MTDFEKPTIVGKIRTAIDDIVPDASDSFTDDTDEELWQAVQHAVMSLLQELPVNMLLPQPATVGSGDQTENTDGSGSVKLPTDFLRFVELQLSTWKGAVYDLMEPGSDEAKRQRTLWGRGTPDKPKAMIGHNAAGNKILMYWSAGKVNDSYSHTISILNYIPTPTVTAARTVNDVTTPAKITCALKPEAEQNVIYLAASIFFEGKKEPETAEKFRNI